ncbi:MAG: cation diffusion facilitator family transporter [Candidatus Thorarchaeota archaeon]|jgi:cation diffusion facilitator family transporter
MDRDEVQKAALLSVGAALFLTLLKLIIGVLSNSLGVLSEGIHSGLDLLAAGITLIAVRRSAQAPDADHQYGHGKVENFSALAETILLWVTSAWIVYEAVRRIQLEEWAEPTLYGILVMSISVVITFQQGRMLSRVAKKHDSQALEADALHFSTDMVSSLVVLVGLGFVWFDFPIADSLSAIGVAIVIFVVSLRLGKRAYDALVDRAPHGIQEEVERRCLSINGVLECRRVRVRGSGPDLFIDVVVAVADQVNLNEAHTISDAIERSFSDLTKRVDVFVHIEPLSEVEFESSEVNVYEALQEMTRASSRIINLHNVKIHEMRGGIYVAADLEMPGAMSLEEAHQVSEELEEKLQRRIPQIAKITFHLETTTDRVEATDITEDSPELLFAIQQLTKHETRVGECHNITITRDHQGITVSLDCKVNGDMSLEQSHELADDVERVLKMKFKQISAVFVHVEPN